MTVDTLSEMEGVDRAIRPLPEVPAAPPTIFVQFYPNFTWPMETQEKLGLLSGDLN